MTTRSWTSHELFEMSHRRRVNRAGASTVLLTLRVVAEPVGVVAAPGANRLRRMP